MPIVHDQMASVTIFASYDTETSSTAQGRVKRVVEELRRRHFRVSFERLPSNTIADAVRELARSIDKSDLVLVLLTASYVSKVEHGDEMDPVRREFSYALRKSKNMLAVLLEADVELTGPVGMTFASAIDCTKTGFKMDQLIEAIQARLATKPAPRSKFLFKPPKTLRSRVARVVQVVGDEPEPTENTYEIVDRLWSSLGGTRSNKEEGEQTLSQRLEQLELEVGISDA